MGAKVEDKGLQLHQKSDKAVREAYFATKGESYKPIDPKTGKTAVRPLHGAVLRCPACRQGRSCAGTGVRAARAAQRCWRVSGAWLGVHLKPLSGAGAKHPVWT